MNNKFFNQDWNSMNWRDLQKQYIESIDSFFKTQSKPQFPWEQAMDYWWKTNNVSMPFDQLEVFNKIMNQGRSFYFLGEQLSNLLELLSTQKKTKKNWMKMLDEQIELMKQAYNAQSNSYQEGLFSEWNTSEQAWQSVMNFIPGLDKNISEAEFQDYMEKFLSMPGLGLNRELQEKVQHTILSFKRYQEINKKYNDAMSQVASNGLDLLKEKLFELTKKKENIDSLRAVYDLWVDCNEEVYGEYVLSEEYSELYGSVVNSLMMFKKDITELMNEVYSSYNMTSKGEFDELAKEQYVLKRKLKEAEQEKNKEKARITALEKEISELKAAIINTKNPTTTSKKKTAKSKKKKAKTKVKARSNNAEEKKQTTTRKKRYSKKKIVRKARRTSVSSNDNVIEIKF